MKSEGRNLIPPATDGLPEPDAESRRHADAAADNAARPAGRRAFVPRDVALACGSDLLPDSLVTEHMDMARPSLKLPLIIIAAAMALWIGGGIATLAGMVPWRITAQDAALLVVMVVPILLLAIMALQLIVIRRGTARSASEVRQAGDAILATQSEIEDGHKRLRHSAESAANLAEQAVRAMGLAADSMGGHQTRIAEELDRGLVQIDALAEKLDLVTRAAPRIEDRLAKLTQVLGRSADELVDRGGAIEQQFRTAATASEDARRKLIEANRSLATQLATLQEGARGAGEELAGMSELASARIDLTLDRMRTVLDETDTRIDDQTQTLVRLADEHDMRTGRLGEATLARVREESEAIGQQIDAVAARLSNSQQEVKAWFAAMGTEVADLSAALSAMEDGAADRGDKVSKAVERLTTDAQAMMSTLSTSGNDAEHLIRRAETLLLALDSGLRELDESLPAAFTRADERIATLRASIATTVPAIESLEAIASGAVSQVRETEHIAQSQASLLKANFVSAQSAIKEQEASLSRLVAAVSAARSELEALGAAPDNAAIQAFARVGEAAQAAADKARTVISAVIPDAVLQLGQASEDAIAQSVAGALVSQLDQLSAMSDNAVKSVHRATDKLNRQMLTLSDTSAKLEDRIKSVSIEAEQQDRDYLSARSAAIIGALNSRAIDVSKWLDQNVTQPEWNAYLKGDQSLFARRAVRLMSTADARQVHAMYQADADFAEHVSRYLHDFEALLRAMLDARDGSTLAVTMLASDIGKLYVALAQATSRLRG